MPLIASLGGSLAFGRPQKTGISGNLQFQLRPSTYSGSGTTWTNTQNATVATLYNSPAFDSATGFTFNGSTQYAGIPDVAGVTDFSYGQSYTVEVWIKIAAVQNDTATADNDIVEKWNTGNEGAYPYVIRWIRGSGNILIACYNGSSNPNVTIPVSTGVWTQIVGVFDGSAQTLYAYKNGAFVSSIGIGIGGTINNSSILNLARRGAPGGASGNNYFTGSIGILRIYNAALLASQISQNYEADRGGFGI